MKDSSAVIHNGSVNGWECKYCKGYNDILNEHCSFCYVYRPDWVTGQIMAVIEIKRGIFIQRIAAKETISFMESKYE